MYLYINNNIDVNTSAEREASKMPSSCHSIEDLITSRIVMINPSSANARTYIPGCFLAMNALFTISMYTKRNNISLAMFWIEVNSSLLKL